MNSATVLSCCMTYSCTGFSEQKYITLNVGMCC